jgi:DNA-binding transcriptional LysR family regulator
MDRLSSMSTFVKAVDLGSFAAAAEASGLSPTMVGKHVRYLETRLGVRLLSRTTRRQSLTEFGRAYYDRCRAILEEVEAADALASDHLNMPAGILRVAMPALLGRVCVAPLLLELAHRHPTLRLDMSMDDRIVDIAADGFDLSVRTGGSEARSGLKTMRLGSHRMVVCASPRYLDIAGAPLTLADLSEHMAIMYARSGWAHAWLFLDAEGRTIEVSPPSRIRLNDLAAVTEAAVAGAGLAWIPAWLARPHLDSGSLVEVLRDQPCFSFENHAVWPEVRHLPLRVRLAIDTLSAELPARLEPPAVASACAG